MADPNVLNKSTDDLFHDAVNEKIKSQTPSYLYDTLSKSNPLPWQKYIDPGASDVVDQNIGRVYNQQNPTIDPNGNKSFQDSTGYENQVLRGVNTNQPKAQPTGNPMLDAINNKYASQYANKFQGLGTQTELNKPAWQSSQLSRATSVLGNIQQNEISNFKEQYAFQQQRLQLYNQWKNAQDQAKGSFFGSLLGIVGTVGAAIATGGASIPAQIGAGALSGAAAGSKG